MSEFLGPVAGWLGLLGLIGLLGLVGIRHPVSRERPGADVRLLGLLGIAGFWIAGAGAAYRRDPCWQASHHRGH